MARRRYCCYYCWFMLISLDAGNTFCSPPPRWGSKTLSCLAASCFFFSSFLVFPWHHTKCACKSQWKHLSIYLYYRIHLSVVASSLAMTPHKLHKRKKGECNCEKKKKNLKMHIEKYSFIALKLLLEGVALRCLCRYYVYVHAARENLTDLASLIGSRSF